MNASLILDYEYYDLRHFIITMWYKTFNILFIVNSFFSSMESSKLLFISSWSQIYSPGFVQILDSTINDRTEAKLLYIPTAQYAWNPQSDKSKNEQKRRARYDSKQKIKSICDILEIKCYNILELDCMKTTETIVKNYIEDANIIYIDGGNTFYLQKYLTLTNFFDIFIEHLNKNHNYIYIGVSAGAIVAGQSIETAYWKGWDDPNAAGKDFIWNKHTLKGASLVDNSFFMHYDHSIHENLVIENLRSINHLVKTIANNEAMIYKKSENNKNVFEFESIYVNNM